MPLESKMLDHVCEGGTCPDVLVANVMGYVSHSSLTSRLLCPLKAV